jgi:hypothetical protein
MKKLDLSGQRFTHLLVIAAAAPKKKITMWLCRCDCGGTAVISRNALRSGKQGTCGCSLITGREKHGMTDTPEWRTWRHMLERCNDPKSADFPEYGARGITVCERWTSFSSFLADMGPRPAGTSIERENNDRGYAPGNCVWGTLSTQARNKRTSRLLTYNGRTQNLVVWAAEVGISRECIEKRIDNLQWSIDRALTTPIRSKAARPCVARPSA